MDIAALLRHQLQKQHIAIYRLRREMGVEDRRQR